MKARLGNGVFFPTWEQGSPTGEGVSIVPSFTSRHKEHYIVLPEIDHLCSQKSCLLLAHAASLGVNIKMFIFSLLQCATTAMKCVLLSGVFCSKLICSHKIIKGCRDVTFGGKMDTLPGFKLTSSFVAVLFVAVYIYSLCSCKSDNKRCL